MNKIERELITKLFMYDDEMEYVEKEKILSIPLKMWRDEAKRVVKEYKNSVMTGRSFLEVLNNPELKDILNEALKNDGYSTFEKTENLVKSLQEDYYRRELENISKSSKNTMEDLGKLYQEMLSETKERQKENSMNDLESLIFEGLESTNRVKTGDMRFDKFVHFTKKDLNIIAARPGVGKSSFSLYLALGMAKAKKGLFFNLEMTNTQLAQRICSMKTKIPLENICEKEKFYQLSRKDRDDIREVFQSLSKLNLKLLDGNYTITEIRERIRMEKELNELDFVFVDYLQLIKSFERTEYERVTEVSKSLKRIAKEFDITIVALSQMNRQADTEKAKVKDVFLSDLRSSGQIEQDGSVILGLLSTPTEIENKELFKVKILKNRQGMRGTLEYFYYKSNQNFFAK